MTRSSVTENSSHLSLVRADGTAQELEYARTGSSPVSVFTGSKSEAFVSAGMTDDGGSVRLDVIVDHPVQIIVIAAGYEPQTIDLLEHPIRDDRPTAWLDADPAPALATRPPRLEVRISP